MAQNHIQKGATMPWTNGTGSDVSSGGVVVVGELVCIALGDIADGDAGMLAVGEVWELPKAAPLVIDQGDRVYWDVADGEINKTSTDNEDAGVCFEAAVSAATTVKVLINA